MLYGEGVQRTTLYLPIDLQRALRDEARRRGRPQAQLVREALHAYLSSQERPPVTSVGLGEDGAVSARDAEAWLEREWGRP